MSRRIPAAAPRGRGAKSRGAPAAGTPRTPARTTPPRDDARASRTPPPLDPIAADRAGRALWIALAVLALARLAAPLTPSMWAWGLNAPRFLPAPTGWLLAAITALALVPPVATAIARWLDRISERAPGARFVLLWAAGAGLIAWLLPDQVHHVGDFELRLGAAAGGVPTSFLFPQALPLDLFIHHTFPRAVSAVTHLDVPTVVRAIGTIEAAVFGALAATFARQLGLRGTGASMMAAIALFGGTLGMFTGYGKAFRELGLLVALIGVSIPRIAAGRGGLLALGIAVAAGLTLHRSAIAFVVPWLAAVAVVLRRSGPTTFRTPANAAGLLIPLATLALMESRIVKAMGVDRVHLAPEGGGLGKALALAANPLHLADIANTLLVLSPIAVVIPILMAVFGRELGRRRSAAALLLALDLPLIAGLFLIHPTQGMFRDWDIFTATGVALSFTAAWLIGEMLRAAPSTSAIGVAAATAAIATTLQWLALQHDLAGGMRRVIAYATEAPARSIGERASSWSYLSIRYASLDRYDQAADAARRAADAAPSPRLLYEWASAEAARGDLQQSREVLLRLTAKAPTMADAWRAMVTISDQLGDSTSARRAAEKVLTLSPNDREARARLERSQPGSAPDSAR